MTTKIRLLHDTVGIPTGAVAVTQSASDNTTKVATTAYVTTALAALADSAPSTLNTLNELAAALGDDANFSTTVTNSIATKAPLASPTLTGSLNVVPTAATGLTYAADGTNSYINFKANSVGDSVQLYAGQSSGGFFSIGTKNSSGTLAEKMRIDSSGKVMIGSTNPGVGGTIDLSVGSTSSSGGITLWAPTSSAHSIGFGDGYTGTDRYRGYLEYLHSSDSMRFGTSATERMRIDSSGNVGIGCTPDTLSSGYTGLQINGYAYLIGHSGGDHYMTNNAYFNSGWKYGQTSTAQKVELASGRIALMTAASGSADSAITWNTGLVQDSSGNLMIGKTAANTTAAGNVFFDYGRHGITVNATTCQVINRLGNDGTFTVFQKDNSNVGQIDVLGGNNLTISGSATNHAGLSFATNAILPAVVGATNNGAVDLGASSERFKDGHFGGSLYAHSGQFVIATDSGGSYIGKTDNATLRLITNNTTRITIRNDGGIGIGNNNAGYSSQILSVKSAGEDNVFYGESTDTRCIMSLRDNSSNTNVGFGAVANAHVFFQDTTEVARISSGSGDKYPTSGNGGIGGAGSNLHLAGDDSEIRMANNIIHSDNSGLTKFTIRNAYGYHSTGAELSLDSGYITFNTGTSYAERWRINSSGHFTPNNQHAFDIGGTNAEVRNIYAQGISFASNAHAGGMSNELLDDYEEGTWTPVLGNTAGTTATHSSQTGKYTKIGNTVHVHGTIQCSAGANVGGTVIISGLPFTSFSTGGTRNVGQLGALSGCGSEAERLRLVLDPNNAYIFIIKQNGQSYTHSPAMNAAINMYGFSIVYSAA
tara:strand:- start:2010 stop:4469 length:2460 start_codon:yes stop_codon:yes gene_type:complete